VCVCLRIATQHGTLTFNDLVAKTIASYIDANSHENKDPDREDDYARVLAVAKRMRDGEAAGGVKKEKDIDDDDADSESNDAGTRRLDEDNDDDDDVDSALSAAIGRGEELTHIGNVISRLFRDGLLREALPHDVAAEDRMRVVKFMSLSAVDDKKRKKGRRRPAASASTTIKKVCGVWGDVRVNRSIPCAGTQTSRQARAQSRRLHAQSRVRRRRRQRRRV
jgi:hypothetical protein